MSKSANGRFLRAGLVDTAQQTCVFNNYCSLRGLESRDTLATIPDCEPAREWEAARGWKTAQIAFANPSARLHALFVVSEEATLCIQENRPNLDDVNIFPIVTIAGGP